MAEKKIDLDELKKLMVNPRVGEILVQHKKISVYQLAEVLEEQKTNKSPIGRILIDKGYITENELVELLSLQINIDKLLKDSYSELEKLDSGNS